MAIARFKASPSLSVYSVVTERYPAAPNVVLRRHRRLLSGRFLNMQIDLHMAVIESAGKPVAPPSSRSGF